MVTGVPSQEGAEGNVAEKKKVNESMEANLGKLLKYNAWSIRWSLVREVKGAAPPCGVKGQRPLRGQEAEPLAGAMAEKDAFLVDYVEGGLCVDNTDAGIVGRCKSRSNKDKGKDSLRAQDSDKGKGKEVVGPSVNMTEEGKNKKNKGKKRDFKEHGSGSGSNKKPKLMQLRGIDSGATTHVCKDRCWFKTYEPVEDGFILYMGDDHFAPVYGKGSVVLEFSSRKSITLFNVLYVPNLRFGYYNNGHVHYKRMLKMSKDELIPVIDENPDKCPYTPQQNGVAKRKNRALKEMVNSMLSYSVGKLCGLKVSPSRSLVRICRGYNPLKPRQLPRGATWLSDPLTRLLTGGQPPLTDGPTVVRGWEYKVRVSRVLEADVARCHWWIQLAVMRFAAQC
ncbi:zinc finger, CCHC-type containing protein [Tanacetum coccineum]